MTESFFPEPFTDISNGGGGCGKEETQSRSAEARRAPSQKPFIYHMILSG